MHDKLSSYHDWLLSELAYRQQMHLASMTQRQKRAMRVLRDAGLVQRERHWWILTPAGREALKEQME